jgi:dTDP-L-rhamnose 4-epimerase
MLARAVHDVDVVVHFAATVGVGQSMYEIGRYTATNSLGTANLLDLLARRERGSIRKLIVASSMSVYGEGAYSCPGCSAPLPSRPPARMAAGEWEPVCAPCGSVLAAEPTSEAKTPDPTSVYALNKLDQEKLCLIVGEAYAIPTVALRFFNVYGPRQSLSNPYPGVAAIFSSRIKAGKSPLLYEDGAQRRDFVSVHDVVQANLVALDSDAANGQVLNVGSGSAVTVREIADLLLELHGRQSSLEPEVSGRFRTGDVRHCYADISMLQQLGYVPQVSLKKGLEELVQWAEDAPSEDQFDQARLVLESKGLA